LKRNGRELLPSSFLETVYETTPNRPKLDIEVDDDYDDDEVNAVEQEVKEFGW
jgi:hypothetical protein